MMQVGSIRVTIPARGVAELTRPGGAIFMGMDRAGRRLRDDAVNEITRLRAVDTGKMRQAVTWEVVGFGRGIMARVGVDIAKLPGETDYPLIVHEGRGPVRPRRARVLRFRPKGGGAYIFRPRVGPARGKPFLTNALSRFRFQ